MPVSQSVSHYPPSVCVKWGSEQNCIIAFCSSINSELLSLYRSLLLCWCGHPPVIKHGHCICTSRGSNCVSQLATTKTIGFVLRCEASISSSVCRCVMWCSRLMYIIQIFFTLCFPFQVIFIYACKCVAYMETENAENWEWDPGKIGIFLETQSPVCQVWHWYLAAACAARLSVSPRDFFYYYYC